MDPISFNPSVATGATDLSRPTSIAGAAEKFEALLLGQILKEVAAHASDGFGGESDSSSSTLLESGYESLGSALSASGGLGLARLIERQFGSSAAVATTKPKPD